MAPKERSPRPPDSAATSPTDIRGYNTRFERVRHREDEDIPDDGSTIRRTRPPAIATSVNTLGQSLEALCTLDVR